MNKYKFIPMLALAAAIMIPAALRAQNPPMNCAPDGIIEVCTLADSIPPAVAPAAPAPVVPPVPAVRYKDGLLSIVADNVPLSQILQDVSDKTGAKLEVPPDSSTEPVFANLGPGPVRDVLTALLNGSRFNYVIAGLANSKTGLDSIVLTPENRSSQQAPEAQNSSPAPVAAQPPPAVASNHSAFQFDPAEVERLRQEVIQNAEREREEEKKQGASATPPPSEPAN